MNLLLISPDAPPYKGGVSRLAGLLRDGLERLGHQVTLVHPKFRVREIKFSVIPFRRYKERYDLIHLHGPTPLLSDLTLMTRRKVPIVYTHHAEICWISEGLSKAYRGFHHFLAKGAQAIIVHSYDYARFFERANVVVVRMPCTFKPPRNFDIEEKANPFKVLYVGQLRPFKGLDVLIKVAKVLRDVDFLLVGEGYLKPKLMRMAGGLENVRFCGAVSDEELEELYKQAHVICLPSVNTTEAYGLVLIEGALHGCIPLASNLIGVRENISQLRGLLFEPKSCASLTERIRMLSKDRELWVNLARGSQKVAYDYFKTYTPDYYVNRHEEVFKKCLYM